MARPIVTFVDEAHHFLSAVIGEEANRWPLDSFELIAKEGRKYGLTLCLATQRPRDLSEGVMSQIGTVIAHRLINGSDRHVIETAAADVDQEAVKLLPSLSSGQALLIGVGFPFPLVMQVQPPTHAPASDGPRFQANWA